MRRHPIAFAFVSAPLDTPQHPPLLPCAQYLVQQPRPQGRSRSRRGPQGDADHHPEVSRRPVVFAFVSAPIDTPSFPLGSLGGNQLCGVWKDYEGDIRGTYTTEGITKLCEGLKGSAVTSLKCAAATKAFAFVSAPADTHLSPSWPHSWQLGLQPALRPRRSRPRHLHRRGHHQAVRGAQGELSDLAEVRRCP